jgi:hypothetical protein
MNEHWFWKKGLSNGLVVILLCFLLLSTIFSAVAGSYYQAQYRRVESELGQIRTDLEQSRNRERELEDCIGDIRTITTEAMGYVQRESDLLLQGGTTIREIRAQVEDLEKYCDSLNHYIIGIRNYLVDKE